MRILCGTVLAVAAMAALPSSAAVGDVLATSAAMAFRLNTLDEMPFVVASQEELEGLMPIGWSKGESVTAIAPSGAADALVAVAEAAGSTNAASCINASGVWRFYNPAYGTVKLGVQSSVFGGGGTVLADSDVKPFVMDTFLAGPNRRGRATGPWPCISFTGDRWAGDGSVASTVTIVDPAGNSVTTNFAGSGAMVFDPQTVGKWTITLVNGLDTLTGDVMATGGNTIFLW
ncbi:MAG: hypothetical protein IKE55_08325 [Kiritimatiellae bacterium]|nr:hypothetical protein [Kiritimatiellia bacterium]